MAKGHSDETKAAVMAALLEGQSISQCAEEYDIPRSTVGNWSAKLNKAGVPDIPDTKKEQIGDLLIKYLRANLATLEAQAEMFRDRKWLEKQGAAEAATLHGVMTDKAVRLLEALTKSEGVPE